MQKENERPAWSESDELNLRDKESEKGKSTDFNKTSIENDDGSSVEGGDVNSTIPKLMRVQVAISNVEVSALLDSGSQASLLSFTIFTKLPKSYRNKLGVGPGECKLFKTISGETLESLGFYNIRFKLKSEPGKAYRQNFYILKDLNEEMVLGLDYLSKNHITLFPLNRELGYISDGENKVMKINSLSIKRICIDKQPVTLKVPEEYRAIVEDLIKRHPNVHASKLSEIGRVKDFEMKIELTTDKPICQKTRRLANAHLPQVKKQIDDLLEAGLIRKSISPYSSNIVVVNKPDGSIRMAIDYKNINKFLVLDSYGYATMQELLDCLQGATVFSTIDVFSAFHCIPLEEESKKFTSFSCIYGSYEYNVMPFGLATSSAFFMRVMNEALKPLMFKNIIAYADDCCVFSSNIKEHKIHLELTFKLLQDAGLKIKLSKCCFFAKEVEYLGFKISGKGIEPSEDKIKPIIDYPQPVNVKTLQRYLGMVLYFKMYIKNFSIIAKPLYELTKKSVRWRFGVEEKRAFETLKEALMTKPILRLPIFSRPFHIFVDASGTGCGGVLSQFHPPFKKFGYENLENIEETEEDEEVCIAFFSFNFNEAQCKYGVTEKEMYSILFAVKKFRQWILGRKCYVITDHKGLEFVFSKPELTSPLMQKWALKLNEYDITIKYRKGVLQKVPDALSRMTQINSLCVAVAGASDWVIEQSKDEYCKKILEEMGKKGNSKEKIGGDRFKILSSGLLSLKDGRIVVPQSRVLEVLKLNHDHKTSGHLGQSKTLNKIGRKYYWNEMAVTIIKHINDCVLCNKRKSLKHGKAPLGHLPVTNEVMRYLVGDLVGPLRESNKGNLYIFNLTDVATRYVISFALKDKTAQLVAERLVNKVFTIFTAPAVFITDGGGEFNSEIMLQICALFGVDKLRSSAFHSIAQGLIEKYNRVCCDMLSLYVEKTPDLWCGYLRYCTLAYNCSKNKSTKFTPFYLFYGREPNLPTDLGKPIRYRSVDNQRDVISQQWHIALEIARENLLAAQESQKKYYDKDSKLQEFEVNEKILLTIPPGPGQKLQLRREGPYKVLRRTAESNYQIIDEKTNKMFVVHTNRMRKFRGDQQKWMIEEKSNELNKQKNNFDIKHAERNTGEDKVKDPPKRRGRPSRADTQRKLEEARERQINPVRRGRGRPKLKPADAVQVTEIGNKLQNKEEKPAAGLRHPKRGRPPSANHKQNWSEWKNKKGNLSENKIISELQLKEAPMSVNEQLPRNEMIKGKDRINDLNPSEIPFKRKPGRPKLNLQNQSMAPAVIDSQQARYNLRQNTKQTKW